MRLRKELDEISDIIDKLVCWICVVLTFLMFVSVSCQVIGRYVTKSTIAWTEETSRYCMIWLAFLGSSTLVRTWDNSSVTFLRDKLPLKTQKIADIIQIFIMLAFMLTIFVISCREVPKYSLKEMSPALRITMFIPKSSVLFGSGIISLQLLWKLADGILAMFEPKQPAGGEGGEQ